MLKGLLCTYPCQDLLSLLFAGYFIATPFIVFIQGLIKKFQNNGNNRSLGISYQQLGSVLHDQGADQQALVYYQIA